MAGPNAIGTGYGRDCGRAPVMLCMHPPVMLCMHPHDGAGAKGHGDGPPGD